MASQPSILTSTTTKCSKKFCPKTLLLTYSELVICKCLHSLYEMVGQYLDTKANHSRAVKLFKIYDFMHVAHIVKVTEIEKFIKFNLIRVKDSNRFLKCPIMEFACKIRRF